MSIVASNNPFPHDPDDNFGDKLDRGGYTGTAQDLKNEIDTIVYPDDILVKGAIIKTGNDIAIAALAFTCRIDQVVYTNGDAYSTTIAAATVGYHRIDILVFTKFSTIVKIQGVEDLESAQEPETPEGTLKIGFFTINGVDVSEPEIPDYDLKEDKANKTGTVIGNESSTTLYLHIAGLIAYFQKKDSQIEISANSNVLNAWHGQTVLFTASCTITVPASLNNSLMFAFRTLTGVTVTWAITSPFTWGTTPTATAEKTVGHFMRRGSTNTIFLDA